MPGQLWGPTGVLPAAVTAPFALDGTPQSANSGSASTLALPAFSTTYAGQVFIAFMTNGGPGLAPTGGGLTFTNRAVVDNTVTNQNTELWSAPSAAPITSQVFTLNTTAANFLTGVIWAFSGVKTSAVFDPTAATTTSTGTYPTFNTSNANDTLFAIGRTGGTVTPPSGFTLIYGANFLGVAYQLVSATQSGTAWTWATGTNGGGTIADGIQQGP